MRKLNLCFFMVWLIGLNACSVPKTQVLLKSEEPLAAENSFYLYPLQLGKTLADTGDISREFSAIEEKAKEILAIKNYKVGPVKSADGLIRIGIETKSTGLATDEELRMMKGAHRSNFPEANPRLKSLEADYLTLEVSLILDNRDVFSAKCQLIENQDALAAPGTEVIKKEEVLRCLEEVIEELP